MEAAPAAQPIAGAAPAAPSPMYTPPPPPMPPAAPAMAEGGAVEPSGGSGSGVGSKIKEFFSDINILDVAVSAFIVGGVLYTVHYFKFMMMMEKTGYADLSAKVQKLENQMAAAKKSAEANATGNGAKRKRPLMSF